MGRRDARLLGVYPAEVMWASRLRLLSEKVRASCSGEVHRDSLVVRYVSQYQRATTLRVPEGS